MRAHQIMTRGVISVTSNVSVREAATLMLERHISGLPVVDETGTLVGMVSEGDFLRRSEIGTQRRRSSWLQFLLGNERSAKDYVLERGRKVGEIMTSPPVTVTEDTALPEIVDLMERQRVKRVPVVRDGKLVGMVTRSNLLRAVASLARDVPDPTADDDHMRQRILDELEKQPWCPSSLSVVVRDGIVHLSGTIIDMNARQAAIVAAENVQGVIKVHDHLCFVDLATGLYLRSPEDEEMAKAS